MRVDAGERREVAVAGSGSPPSDAESVAIVSGFVPAGRFLQRARFALRLATAPVEHYAAPDRWVS